MIRHYSAYYAVIRNYIVRSLVVFWLWCGIKLWCTPPSENLQSIAPKLPKSPVYVTVLLLQPQWKNECRRQFVSQKPPRINQWLLRGVESLNPLKGSIHRAKPTHPIHPRPPKSPWAEWDWRNSRRCNIQSGAKWIRAEQWFEWWWCSGSFHPKITMYIYIYIYMCVCVCVSDIKEERNMDWDGTVL